MATTTIPTTFLYQNSTVCPTTTTGECGNNKTLAKTYQDLTNDLTAQNNKLDDIKTLYGRELAFTFNMILGCIGLGLYIKYNQ